MFVTQHEIDSDPDVFARIRDRVARTNAATKQAGAPTFQVSGPVKLPVLPRKSGFNSDRHTYIFMGGEKFMVSSVSMTPYPGKGVEISVALVPAPTELKLLGEIANIQLPLQSAIENFDGLKDWIAGNAFESVSAREARLAEEKALSHLPSVEQVRASEAWGAW